MMHFSKGFFSKKNVQKMLQDPPKLVTRLQEQVLRSLQTSLGEGQISKSEKIVV